MTKKEKKEFFENVMKGALFSSLMKNITFRTFIAVMEVKYGDEAHAKCRAAILDWKSGALDSHNESLDSVLSDESMRKLLKDVGVNVDKEDVMGHMYEMLTDVCAVVLTDVHDIFSEEEGNE